MGEINYYRLAPTWLFHNEYDPKIFRTQEEVDEAWREGWYGPKGYKESKKGDQLISDMGLETKADIFGAIASDPRYEGLEVNSKMSRNNIDVAILKFEMDNIKGE